MRNRQCRRSLLEVAGNRDGIVLNQGSRARGENRMIWAGEEHRSELLRCAESVARPWRRTSDTSNQADADRDFQGVRETVLRTNMSVQHGEYGDEINLQVGRPRR